MDRFTALAVTPDMWPGGAVLYIVTALKMLVLVTQTAAGHCTVRCAKVPPQVSECTVHTMTMGGMWLVREQ